MTGSARGAALRAVRVAVRVAVALLVAVIPSCGRAPAPSAETLAPSSLVLVTLDTLRADRLGAYGHRDAATPNLDALAAEGVLFRDASTAAPLTLPAHATLLTGLLPPRHGLRNNGVGRLPDGVETLATRLSGAGWRTGAFVGAFVLDGRFGLDRGFERYDDDMPRGSSGASELGAERPGREVVDRALAWLASAAPDDRRPVFLWVHLYDPHAPYAAPEPFRSRHADPYDAEVAAVDHEVGRLLAGLEADGRTESAYVAVVADHGESLGAHGESTHGLLLYQETVRVPLLVRGPGLPAGTEVTAPVSAADLAPTLAGLVGRGLADGVDGRDLSADLLAGREPPSGAVYAETEYPRLFGWGALAALRRGDLKYVAGPRPELFDLAADPGERRDLAAERAAGASSLSRALARLRSAAPPAAPPPAAGDAESRARLASLGYASAGGAPEPAAVLEDSTLPDPKERVALFDRFETAAAELAAGRVGAAARAYGALVAEDPKNPAFLERWGLALRRAGQPDRAVDAHRRAVELAPDDPAAWSNLATALQEAGRLEEALAAVEESLALDADRPEAQNLLGLVLLARGRPEPARQRFVRAVELDPDNARAWNNLGNVLRGLGRPAEAEAAYLRAVAAAPEYPDPENGLGALWVETGRAADALARFDRALTLDPLRYEVRLNRGIAFDVLGDAAAAGVEYRAFLAATADQPSRFTAQRGAARELLARLSAPRAPDPATRPAEGRRKEAVR